MIFTRLLAAAALLFLVCPTQGTLAAYHANDVTAEASCVDDTSLLSSRPPGRMLLEDGQIKDEASCGDELCVSIVSGSWCKSSGVCAKMENIVDCSCAPTPPPSPSPPAPDPPSPPSPPSPPMQVAMPSGMAMLGNIPDDYAEVWNVLNSSGFTGLIMDLNSNFELLASLNPRPFLGVGLNYGKSFYKNATTQSFAEVFANKWRPKLMFAEMLVIDAEQMCPRSDGCGCDTPQDRVDNMCCKLPLLFDAVPEMKSVPILNIIDSGTCDAVFAGMKASGYNIRSMGDGYSTGNPWGAICPRYKCGPQPSCCSNGPSDCQCADVVQTMIAPGVVKQIGPAKVLDCCPQKPVSIWFACTPAYGCSPADLMGYLNVSSPEVSSVLKDMRKRPPLTFN
ncbi:unnamed protein product [Polarella glacialis]|uniref:Uncharacterized protein n=1 Tax=Polarella glacialis TaxID=89957 RepID=A0A813KBJ7_POLGL|nr:unnamed protein product [Polarella glacialis]